MQKRNKKRKLSRKKDQRKALLKSLSRELFLKEKIKTTEAKAKEASIFIEKQITLAKKNNLASRKLLIHLFSPTIVKKVIEIGERYKQRNGGYTRVIKLGPRKSDGAKMAILELVR